jgi:fido (protein-threonine AMPylation protein)
MSEIFYGSADSAESQRIAKALKSGLARKIAPRIYTYNLALSAEVLIQKHIYQIIEHFYPGTVLVHRSAFEVKPKDGTLHLSGEKRKQVKLPGVTLNFLDERGRHPRDTPFLGLFIAHEARAYLENLTRTRHGEGTLVKNLSSAELEKKLLLKLEGGGEEALNKLRDEARAYAQETGMGHEFDELNGLIGALLGTHSSQVLTNQRSVAYLKGENFDEERMKLFTDCFIYFKEASFKTPLDLQMDDPVHFKNKAFFESYFSNYIEGTEFEIEEAEEIIFDRRESDRPKDAHDIIATFEIVSDAGEMRRIPKDEHEFIQILKERHQRLMAYRPEAHPGQWKQKNNRAGSTQFVAFDKVEGTLRRAFTLIHGLPPGLPRACYMMLLVTEVHPFTDGNGRMGRIMMNAELESQGLGSIIIPNAYREEYLLSLKAVSRQQRFQPYCKMLHRALKLSNNISFSDYQKSLKEIKKRNWFLLPSEGKVIDVE